MEAKSAMLENDFEEKLQSQKALAASDFYKRNSGVENDTHKKSLLYAASTVGTDQDKDDAKERIKARFRQRRSTAEGGRSELQKKVNNGSVEQRLHFYERSLQAIERK